MAVQATAVWRVRPSGNNTNGGGYDPSIAGAATDYSKQNAAQATGTNGSATGTTTFTDATALAFTSAMVGNAMYITGGGLTTGWYFVTGFTSSSIVTLDRTPGTGTLATWNLGGGWADFWTNTITGGPLVAGNTVYILGSGTPNPAAYTYDYVANTSFVPLSFNGATVVFANDPGTPGYKAPPDTTGGMPCIQYALNGNLIRPNSGTFAMLGLWFVGSATNAAGNLVLANSGSGASNFLVEGIVFDQFGQDISWGASTVMIGCEAFSSVVPGGTGTNGALIGGLITGCNVHDCVGHGYVTSGASSGINIIINSIFAKCRGDGMQPASSGGTLVQNCTIDGNLGNGIFTSNGRWQNIFNNIISNHGTAGKYGLNVSSTGNTGNNFDYNTYFNNVSNYNPAGNTGPHDTLLGVTPYVGQSTENYTLA